ncbi:MAG: FAD-dependent monooxygenase [Chloroflexi bacterium]|nr:FAD-dependent monooxygenase [Chloroflexota bacterium]
MTGRSGTPSPTEPPTAPAVAVIGAGAVGLTLAGRLAQHGAEVTLFESEPATARIGSRAICMQRETLEIWSRLGIGRAVAARGVQWRIGRTYVRGRELFHVELPTTDEHVPPFVNISQSEVEEMLEARVRALGVEIRRETRLVGLDQDAGQVVARIETSAGVEERAFGYLVGADGAHSAVRHAVATGFDGHTFHDRFLIADIRVELPFTQERHFHFDPPWNPGRQVLLHPQPDGIWRIDWQVAPETDLDAERRSGRLDERIRQVVGPETPYEVVWVTSYRFSQRLADAFRIGRVFLAGDAAHVMSPFGARGLNSGVADAENLAWKLAAVVRGAAPEALLDTYDRERRATARENLAATGSTMRFLAPQGPVRRAWRWLVLTGAERSAWLRRHVDSGRLAEPARYAAPSGSDGRLPIGSVAPDCELPGGGRLRDRLGREIALVVPEGHRGIASAIEVGSSSPYGTDRAWLVRPDGYLAGSAPLDEVDVWIGPAMQRLVVTGWA